MGENSADPWSISYARPMRRTGNRRMGALDIAIKNRLGPKAQRMWGYQQAWGEDSDPAANAGGTRKSQVLQDQGTVKNDRRTAAVRPGAVGYLAISLRRSPAAMGLPPDGPAQSGDGGNSDDDPGVVAQNAAQFASLFTLAEDESGPVLAQDAPRGFKTYSRTAGRPRGTGAGHSRQCRSTNDTAP